MIDVKLEDFEKYRPILLKYTNKLLFNRGIFNRDGELKAFSEDIVQQVYLQFHSWGTDKYVSENHLKSFLIGVAYKEYLQVIDINRRGAQYILLKKNLSESNHKEELRQLDIKNSTPPSQEFFDDIASFKRDLTDKQIGIIDLLLEGYSQKDIATKLGKDITTIHDHVNRIRNKYKKYESTNS